jgi:hypothetical protein
MPFLDMTGDALQFGEHNWARLRSVSTYLHSAAAWGCDAQLDVPKEFLCRVVAARRAFEEAAAIGDAHSNGVAAGALESLLRDGTAMAFAETLDMAGALREMHASLATPSGPWSLPGAVAVMVIGRAVDPLGALTISQLAVVAAVCLKYSDRAFDDVVVSMEHIDSSQYGSETFDSAGTRRIATGQYAEHWLPSRLAIVVSTTMVHVTYLSLASFQRKGLKHDGAHSYHIQEPALHRLLGEQMRVALADAHARTDDATGRTLSAFLRRLSRAIAHGVDPAGRTQESAAVPSGKLESARGSGM